MGRTVRPDSKIRPYVDHLNWLLNKTLTASRLSFLEGTSDYRVITRYEQREIVPLELKPRGWLHLRQGITVRPHDGKILVQEAHYGFSFSEDPDDESASVFMYHYHREGRPNQPQSHFHVYGQRNGRALQEIHFPAGRVSIEQIAAHLLLEHRIRPMCSRQEAIALLRESHLKFMTLRTDEPVFP